MLRIIYLLGLFLLCINIGFCYDYLSDDELNSIPINRKLRVDSRKSRRKGSRKNLAHIDVASFILSPDDSSIDENQSYEQQQYKYRDQGINYGTYGSFKDSNVIKQTSKYKTLDANNPPEVNLRDAKHFVPEHMNLNSLNMDEISSQNIEPYYIKGIKQIHSPFGSKTKRISRTENQCALKNMRFPFFSRENPEATKVKKGKKRRLFGYRKTKKPTTSAVSKPVIHNSDIAESTEANIDINRQNKKKEEKVFKRSYFEKLCPACRQRIQKVFGNFNQEAFVDNSRRKTTNDIIHNSRQFFQRKNNPKAIEIDKPCAIENKPNSLEKSAMKERRWKRDETIEEKQKRVLEDIERKVDSIKVNRQIN